MSWGIHCFVVFWEVKRESLRSSFVKGLSREFEEEKGEFSSLGLATFFFFGFEEEGKKGCIKSWRKGLESEHRKKRGEKFIWFFFPRVNLRDQEEKVLKI